MPDPQADDAFAPHEHDWEYEDLSFDHEFGTERQYRRICKDCGATSGTIQGRPPTDDWDDYDPEPTAYG